MEKRDAQKFLQLLGLGRPRGLGDLQSFSRPGETMMGGNRVEYVQLVEIDLFAPHITGTQFVRSYCRIVYHITPLSPHKMFKFQETG